MPFQAEPLPVAVIAPASPVEDSSPSRVSRMKFWKRRSASRHLIPPSPVSEPPAEDPQQVEPVIELSPELLDRLANHEIVQRWRQEMKTRFATADMTDPVVAADFMAHVREFGAELQRNNLVPPSTTSSTNLDKLIAVREPAPVDVSPDTLRRRKWKRRIAAVMQGLGAAALGASAGMYIGGMIAVFIFPPAGIILMLSGVGLGLISLALSVVLSPLYDWATKTD